MLRHHTQYVVLNLEELMKKLFGFVFFGTIVLSCNNSAKKFETQEGLNSRNKVDEVVIVLDSAITKFDNVLRIDHSRLAEGEEVYTPPSIVTIFSNPKVNSSLLKINQLVGIDLPYKVLCYSEPDLVNASIAYTSSDFIRRRHGLTDLDLISFSKDMDSVVNSFPEGILSSTDLKPVSKNFGLIVKKSDFDFVTTIDHLKKSIQEQGDTKIFGEIDFKKEGSLYGVAIDPTTLILFGAPAPGGKAMNKTPKIGLDAFCQKLLIFEKEHEVFVAYNDIIDFSDLYYQKWTIPQRVVNYRLNSVYENAITEK